MGFAVVSECQGFMGSFVVRLLSGCAGAMDLRVGASLDHDHQNQVQKERAGLPPAWTTWGRVFCFIECHIL